MRVLRDLLFARNIDRLGQINGWMGYEYPPQRCEQHSAIGIPLAVSGLSSARLFVFLTMPEIVIAFLHAFE